MSERALMPLQRRLPRGVSIRALRRTLAVRAPDTILVDYFGTIVTRSVPPWYVKALAWRRLAEQLALDIDPLHFSRVRAEIEQRLCEDAVGRGLDPCFCVEDAALACARHLQQAGQLSEGESLEPTHVADMLVEAEIEAELRVQRVDLKMVELLQAHARNARCILVSDFHIGQPSFDRLLEHHGLAKLFDRVFVSCDYGRTKKSGALFELITTELALRPGDTLVIGDHPVSDGRNALAAGMRSHLIRGGQWERDKKATAADVARDVERRLTVVLEPNDQCDLFRPMALTLYVFVRRLHEFLRADGVSNAFFLAREGKFLARLFSVYQEEIGFPESNRIIPHYLLVSRRATYLPSLPELSAADFAEFLDRAHRPTLADFLAALGFDPHAFERLATALTDDPMGSAPLDLDAVKGNRQFAEEYELRRSSQRAALLAYLDQTIGLSSRSVVHLVDVGWRGGIQDHLSRVVPADGPELRGSYLGLLATGALENADSKRGILFHNRPDRSAHLEVFAYFKTLFEVLLAADHGSVNGYESAADGQTVATTDDIPEERAAFARHIAPMQSNIEDRFRVVCRELELSPLQGGELVHLAARYHAQMVYRPSRAELRFFEQLPFYDAGKLIGRRLGMPRVKETSAAGALMLVRGGGWPPLRLRAANVSWLRFPYGWYKVRVHERRARACSCAHSL